MLDNSMFLEKLLQNYRLKLVKPHLFGDVLDFGGNKEELKKYVEGKYLSVNYDHSVMENTHFDTIADLAEEKDIKSEHLSEAIQYRSLDIKFWLG